MKKLNLKINEIGEQLNKDQMKKVVGGETGESGGTGGYGTFCQSHDDCKDGLVCMIVQGGNSYCLPV